LPRLNADITNDCPCNAIGGASRHLFEPAVRVESPRG
jgi:hypothetical protein